MAVYKPLVIEKNETDIKKIMRQLYRFSEDLKFTISNLSLDDNFSKESLDAITERGATVREIKFDTDGFSIEYENYKTGVLTRLDQTEDTISFLVDSGSVVKEMLTRMELHGEYIRLTSGHILINAQNMTLDAAGNAVFSGAINGGSININNRFIVYPNGDCYVDDSLKTETLNPAQGVTAADMEVYNDNDYINTIGRTVTCSEAYISETLSCNRVRYTSDQRKKREIHPLPDVSMLIRNLRPVRYCINGRDTIGYIAQEVQKYAVSESDTYESDCIPVVGQSGEYMELPYSMYTAVYARAIQEHQKRLDRMKRELKEMGEDVKF